MIDIVQNDYKSVLKRIVDYFEVNYAVKEFVEHKYANCILQFCQDTEWSLWKKGSTYLLYWETEQGLKGLGCSIKSSHLEIYQKDHFVLLVQTYKANGDAYHGKLMIFDKRNIYNNIKYNEFNYPGYKPVIQD